MNPDADARPLPDEPAAGISRRGSGMFRSFRSVNYRFWFVGALVSNIGTWMQATALNWVVLTEVTDADATAVGITMALQFAPPLLLVPVTGWVTDRFDRRHVLMATQLCFAALAVLLGLLLLGGAAQLWQLYLLAALFGVVMAFDTPARQTIVTDIVSLQNASNAVALNSAAFNAARLIGPAVAGFTIVAVGSGWVFLINAVTFLLMFAMILLLRANELASRPRDTRRSRLLDGFHEVARRRDLQVVFLIVFLLGAFGMNFPVIASTMALEFGRDADGFGLLSSILAIGSLTGALLAARRERARISVVIAASGGFAAASVLSALMPGYWWFAASLILTGFSVVTVLTTANGVVQTTTDPRMRGRVMALYMAILMGGTPVGAPIVGWVADTWGPRWAIGVGAAATAVGCALGVWWLISSGRVHRGDRAWRLTLDETRTVPVAGSSPPAVRPERDARPRSARVSRVRVLWGACHPGPTLVVTVLTTGLGVVAGLPFGRLALLAAVIFLGQVSIGLSNDARDVARDRATGRADKPLAAPGGPVRLAWSVAFVALGLGVAGTLGLGFAATVAHAVLVGAGWAYNLWLKSSIWSAACFVIAFGGLPSIAYLARAEPAFAPTWATVAGAVLGVAIHFSNVLPDFDDDARTGVRGLPHRLGVRWSAFLVFAALTAGAITVAGAVIERATASEDAPVRAAAAAIGAAAVIGLGAWAWIATLRRGATRLGFRLVMASAAVLVALAALAGSLGA